MSYRIPFNKPFIVGKELFYISQSILSGHSSGDGPFTQKCQEFFEHRFEAEKVLMTTSCTSALEMSALLCNISEGDEVIMPSYTFVSTANAFLLRGATIKFVDIRPDTKNIDENLLVSAITKDTKAIIPVHYAGVACEMESIIEIASDNSLYVIEDAAQGVNAKYKSDYLGTIGDLGAFSFHETKNFICGEGGALVINNPEFIKRAEIIREKGTNRSQFFRGEIDKYTWVDVGSSYVPSDLLSAFLLGQLDHMDDISVQREKIYNSYIEGLNPLVHRGLIELPVIPDECKTNNHMFYFLLDNVKTRSDLIKYLKKSGILAVFHYVPLHLSPIGKKLGYSEGELPVTEKISERILRLPFYYELSPDEVNFVINKIFDFFLVKR